MKYVEYNMGDDFLNDLFTYKSHVTLDGPEVWGIRWVVNGWDRHQRLGRQDGEGTIMFWAGIIGSIMVGLWKRSKCWWRSPSESNLNFGWKVKDRHPENYHI